MSSKSAKHSSGARSEEAVVVVSGLPRSGTSMLMSMLEAGGLTVVSDHLRTADEDNPKGYHEYEPVKQLHRQEDKTWIGDARGKAIKVISQLLKALPGPYRYKVVFLHRNLEEVIASQNKMLVRRGQPPKAGSDEQMMALFREHVKAVKEWLARQSNFEVIHVKHKDVLDDPQGQAKQINKLLNLDLDAERMAAAVDRNLYRNRS